jgi:hypothetical protein
VNRPCRRAFWFALGPPDSGALPCMRQRGPQQPVDRDALDVDQRGNRPPAPAYARRRGLGWISCHHPPLCPETIPASIVRPRWPERRAGANRAVRLRRERRA